MQKMLKKILKTIFLLVILCVFICPYAFAAQAVPTDKDDKARVGRVAKKAKIEAAPKETPKQEAPKEKKSVGTRFIEGLKGATKQAARGLVGIKKKDEGADAARAKKAAAAQTPEKEAEKEAEKAPEREKTQAEREAKEAAKTPAEREAEEKAAKEAAAIKEAAKTPAERAAEEKLAKQQVAKKEQAAIYEEVKERMSGGQDISEMGPWDRKCAEFTLRMIKRSPEMAKRIVAISRFGAKQNDRVKASPVGRLQAKSKSFSASVKAKLYGGPKKFSTDKEFEKMRGTPEWKSLRESVQKELADGYVRKGMTEAAATEKAANDLAQTPAKQLEADMRSALERKNLEKKAEEWERKNPKAVAKMKAKIAKDLAIKAKEEAKSSKKRGEAPAKEATEQEKEVLVREMLRASVKEDLGKTWFDKYNDAAQKRRAMAANPKAMGFAALLSGLVQVAASLIGKEVEKSVKAAYASPQIGKAPVVSQKESFYGVDELTPEDQKDMDALEKLTAFYSTMDVKFKNVLSKFDYEDTVFQTVEKVKYVGGTMTAGIALLFNYKCAGDIAEGFTPIVVRFYPEQISGNAVDPVQASAAVGNLDALELITSLRICSPDVIFFIKAISLLNTANKNFIDVAQRQLFLGEQMNLLFARFIRTVDDDATRRANIIEKDDEKWDPVYMDNPAECFGSAPKVLRDFMAELTVEILDADGKVVKISFEEYIIDQFNEFDDVFNVEFEGDVDYDVEAQELDDAEVKLRLCAIFLRALDDVLRLEKELFEEKTPVKIKDAQGKEQMFDGKKFYMEVTKVAFSNLQKVQKKFLDATVEYGADMTDANSLKAYNSAYKNYMQTVDVYSKAVLEFRKKVSFYTFEKTLGYAPERILDFVKRECKRTYQEAENKEYFRSVLPEVFKPFTDNFPFSAQDLLTYSQEPGPVKSPVRLFVDKEVKAIESQKTEVGDVQVSKQLGDEVISDKNDGEVISSQVTPSSFSINSSSIINQDKEKPQDIFGVKQVKPRGKIITPVKPMPNTSKTIEEVADKVPEKVADKVPEKVADKVPEKVADKVPEKVEGKVNVGI